MRLLLFDRRHCFVERGRERRLVGAEALGHGARGVADLGADEVVGTVAASVAVGGDIDGGVGDRVHANLLGDGQLEGRRLALLDLEVVEAGAALVDAGVDQRGGVGGRAGVAGGLDGEGGALEAVVLADAEVLDRDGVGGGGQGGGESGDGEELHFDGWWVGLVGGEVGESAEGPKETERRINIDIPASEEPLVPLAPPMLPHNAIRQSITPKAYPDIYGKIVVAGQTPKVPINLAHMTRALVQGWKDDGEWPPRPGPVDPLMGRKKIAIGGGKVSTLAAVLGGGSGDNKGNASTGSAHHGEFLAHHPHLQRGVESVKKVFRLSGGHHGHSNPGGGLVHDGQPPAS